MACNWKDPVPGSASGSALRLRSNSGVQFENSSFGDTTDTKLFVGGLPWEKDRNALRRHFQKFGEIREAVVINEKNTGKSKGYGFVTFSDRQSAARACEDPIPVIDGRKANCNLASRGRPQIDSAGYTRPGSAGSFYYYYYYYPSVIYDYRQGFAYPVYGYSGYGAEHMYPQNISGGQNLQMQRFSGLVMNPSSISLVNVCPPVMRFLQLRGTNLNGMVTAGTIPAAIQSPYPPGGSDHQMAA